MPEKRRLVLKVPILVRTLMLLKVSLVCFLSLGEPVVLEEIVNEAVEDAVVVDQLPSSREDGNRAARLTHTVGFLPFC